MKAAAVAVLCFILAAAAVEGYAPAPARALLGPVWAGGGGLVGCLAGSGRESQFVGCMHAQ
jgi:hypothetical protein